MIPKIVHYCWFGDKEKPQSVKHNINLWKEILPKYEIIEWNESNFDINYNTFVREAYDNKKYAFVSDIARLYALIKKGGIYLDTDVELIRPFDDLLDRDILLGREYSGVIGTATIGACANNTLLKAFLQTYDRMSFVKEDGSFNTIPNVVHFTEFINKKYPNIEIFDQYYFSPKHPATRICHTKKCTYCIHHFDGSWLSDEQIKKRQELRDRIIGFFIDVNAAKRIYRKLWR